MDRLRLYWEFGPIMMNNRSVLCEDDKRCLFDPHRRVASTMVLYFAASVLLRWLLAARLRFGWGHLLSPWPSCVFAQMWLGRMSLNTRRGNAHVLFTLACVPAGSRDSDEPNAENSMRRYGKGSVAPSPRTDIGVACWLSVQMAW